MNQLVYILLSLSILIQAGSKTLLLVHHEANKATITELFCINKARPELNCHGSCHLKKKLQEADTAEKQTQQMQEKQADLTLFCQQAFPFSMLAYQKTILEAASFYHDQIPVSPALEVFHPPA